MCDAGGAEPAHALNVKNTSSHREERPRCTTRSRRWSTTRPVRSRRARARSSTSRRRSQHARAHRDRRRRDGETTTLTIPKSPCPRSTTPSTKPPRRPPHVDDDHHDDRRAPPTSSTHRHRRCRRRRWRWPRRSVPASCRRGASSRAPAAATVRQGRVTGTLPFTGSDIRGVRVARQPAGADRLRDAVPLAPLAARPRVLQAPAPRHAPPRT